MTLQLNDLNQASAQDAREMLKGIYEHSDWIDEQAAEVLYREKINETLRNQQGFAAMADVSAQQAGSGHEGGGISSQLEVKRQTDLQNMISSQEAEFQARMLEAGGSLTGQAGQQAQTAGFLGAATSLIGGASKILNPSSGYMDYGGTQSLPAPGQGFRA